MPWVFGVENASRDRIGGFDDVEPKTHRGIDVFAPPGSRVRVPKHSELTIVRTSYHPNYYKGSGYGWLTMCGKRWGIVIAHMAEAPAKGTYQEGDVIGVVSGGVPFTPHAHIALARDRIPPPGEVDPLRIWKRCLRRSRRS